jgi:ATP-dependent RNA helicase DHX29
MSRAEGTRPNFPGQSGLSRGCCRVCRLGYHRQIALCFERYVSDRPFPAEARADCTAVWIANAGRQNRNQLEWAEEPALDDDDEGETPVQADPKQLSSALYSQDTVKTVNLLDPKQIPYELVIRLLEELCLEQKSAYSQAILIFLPGLNEIRKLHDLLQDHKSFGMPQDFRVYPLHSSISTENQGAVFEIPPEGVRKIVLCKSYSKGNITGRSY